MVAFAVVVAVDITSDVDDARSWDLITVEVAIYTDKNTHVIGLVELRGKHPIGKLCPGPFDLDVEALRVVLRAIHFPRPVQGNDLMAEDVVTRLELLWDPNEPALVLRQDVGVELVRPVAEASIRDLEELQAALVHRLAAFAATRG
ncbi:unnamed protein product [Clonostachys rhizophaga]|uniref:Uncharacterized protein n=1 Tax=Clonostachys rhizophaga TaxID=160324 RepID=A0A9N9VKI2_9HYPO|nr:unnamed protein product [Clonostachys rhizophaga]